MQLFGKIEGLQNTVQELATDHNKSTVKEKTGLLIDSYFLLQKLNGY